MIFELEKICKIYQPKTISKSKMSLDGKYNVFGANGIIGKYNSYNHEESEIAITCRGATCGNVNYTLPYSWITGNAMVVKPNDSNIDKRYLYYYLCYYDLGNVITGTAQPQITRANLKNILIKIYDLNIQKKIVEELDKINKSIQNRIETLKDLDDLINSRFNENIKKNMGYKKLKEICKLNARIGWQGLTKKEYMCDGAYKLITGIDFNDGKIDFSKCVYISEKRFNQDTNIQIKKGDILVTKDGTIGKVAYIDEIPFNATLNSGIFVVRIINNIVEEKYLYYLLKTEYFINFVEKIKTGSTISHLNQIAFYDFIIPILNKEDEKELILFVNNIEKQKELVKLDLQNLKLLFESKMHNYFDLQKNQK